MDRTRLLALVMFAAELFPAIAVWRTRSHDSARVKLALLCLVWFGFEMASTVLGHLGHHNLWLGYLLNPIQACLVFWLLYDWQTTPAAQLALRLLMPSYLITTVALNLRFEDSDNFSLLTDTLTAIVLLCVVLFTLVTRSLNERSSPLLDLDWFWVCTGLAFYFSLEAGVSPLLRYLLAQRDYDAMVLVQDSRIVASMFAMLILTRGMLCPEAREPDGLRAAA